MVAELELQDSQVKVGYLGFNSISVPIALFYNFYFQNTQFDENQFDMKLTNNLMKTNQNEIEMKSKPI